MMQSQANQSSLHSVLVWTAWQFNKSKSSMVKSGVTSIIQMDIKLGKQAIQWKMRHDDKEATSAGSLLLQNRWKTELQNFKEQYCHPTISQGIRRVLNSCSRKIDKRVDVVLAILNLTSSSNYCKTTEPYSTGTSFILHVISTPPLADSLSTNY